MRLDLIKGHGKCGGFYLSLSKRNRIFYTPQNSFSDKRVEFVSDMVPHIVLRGRCCKYMDQVGRM